jgi:hypothetical protein
MEFAALLAVENVNFALLHGGINLWNQIEEGTKECR